MFSRVRSLHEEKGSLIIELMVAFALISVTLVVVMDAFMVSQRGGRESNDRATVIRSLYFLLDEVGDEFQKSDTFTCTGTPCNSATGITMTRVDGVNGQSPDTVTYALSGGKITKTVGGTTVDVTPPSITVQAFRVYLYDTAATDPTDVRPSRLLISVSAAATADTANTGVTTQTTITSRFH